MWTKAPSGFKLVICGSQAWYFNHWAMILNQIDVVDKTILQNIAILWHNVVKSISLDVVNTFNF